MFAPRVIEQIGYYVYLLIDPRDDAIFYVGKGTGNRCFAHLTEARKTQADTVADYAKLARIREIEDAGEAVRIDILRHGLSEPEAFHVESAAIDLVDPSLLTNRVAGHDTIELGRMSIADVNAIYGAEPVDIHTEHRVVLIRISRLFERGMSAYDLYEATRKWWRVGSQRREQGNRLAPRWAMAVYGGVVRAVYRIEGWEQPTEVDIAEDSGRVKRWAFRGRRDPAMERIYAYRDVTNYLTTASGVATQSPLRYINCE